MNIFLTGGSGLKLSFLRPLSLEVLMIMSIDENHTEKCIKKLGLLELI